LKFQVASRIRLTEILSLDARGRIVIPKNIRKLLDLDEHSQLMLEADSERKEMRLLPFYDVTKTVQMRIIMDDIPGSLAAIAQIFGDLNLNLLYGTSRIIQRGKVAEWTVLSPLPTNITLEDLRAKILEKAKDVEFIKSAEERGEID
jgi:AbrB family looped-hinge helix DNA binding protein